MSDIRIERVTALPPSGSRKSGTIYLVADAENPSLAEMHITGNSPADLRRLVNLNDVDGQIADRLVFEHVQMSASLSWTVNHNLGRFPSVTVMTVGGLEMEPDVLHVSNNQTQINFVTPVAGRAIFA